MYFTEDVPRPCHIGRRTVELGSMRDLLWDWKHWNRAERAMAAVLLSLFAALPALLLLSTI